MAKDDDQPRPKVFDRVFDTAEPVLINQIARGPNHKQIANVLIEDNFRRRPRIGTPNDDRKRMLAFRGFCAFGRRWFAAGDGAFDKTGIAFLEFRECGFWSETSNRVIGAESEQS
jgi:hypothetical protein